MVPDQELLDKLTPTWYRLGMATRSVRFPRDLLDRLDDAADRRDVSTNWLIIKLCEQGLEHLRPGLTVIDFAEIEVTS
jgi:hypothetical protein